MAGIYIRTSKHKKQSIKNLGIGTTGKHWKVKDTSNVSKSHIGLKYPNRKKIKLTEERKRKIGLKMLGNKYAWRGGSSFFPYSIDWSKTLRTAIRERDKYTCQLCKEKQSDFPFHIHHIDYNKLNSNPNNLITLCPSCHMKTNGNRKYWIDKLKCIMQA